MNAEKTEISQQQRHGKCEYNEGKLYRANMFLLFHIIKKMFGDDFCNRNNHFMSELREKAKLKSGTSENRNEMRKC